MKRILYFDNSDTGKVGGSHHSLLLLVKHLDSSKYEKIVVLNSDNALRPEFEKYCEKVIVWNGLSANSFWGITGRDLNPKFKKLGDKAYRVVNSLAKKSRMVKNDIGLGAYIAARYFALLRRERIDLLHLNNWFDPYWILAATLRRIPIIQHTRGASGFFYPPFCHWVDKVICISDDVAGKILKGGISPNKIVRIYNAIDTNEFRPQRDASEVRSELGIGGSHPVVAIFGNIQRWKGQDVVIRACSRLKAKYPKLVCVLFGDIIEEDFAAELQALAHSENLNGNVIFGGYRPDVADCMNASDIIVHASTSPEPFGRVIIEGMTLGKPVVASADGAAPEIIENETSGLLFAPGDWTEMAGKIDFLLRNPEKANKLSINAMKRATQKFDISGQIKYVEDVYRISDNVRKRSRLFTIHRTKKDVDRTVSR